MQLKNNKELLSLLAPVCTECGKDARLGETTEIYGKDYGKAWLCADYPDCDNYCGVHRDTNKPLGTMANKELRQLRKRCHKAFDDEWRYGDVTRNESYEQLANWMKIPVKECHFGMMDVKRCETALILMGGSIDKGLNLLERLRVIEFNLQKIVMVCREECSSKEGQGVLDDVINALEELDQS